MNYLWEAIMWEGSDTHKELHGRQMHSNTHTHTNTKGEYRHTYKYSQVLEIVVMHVYCGSMYTG